MAMLRIRTIAVACLVCASASPPLRGQSASLVPADDPIYTLIDRLASLVPVNGVFIGQRPYSRRTIAVIARRFEAALERSSPALPDDVRRVSLELLADLTRRSAAPSDAVA